ncbi:MAG: universal stress protein [Pseudomonadota bacterium]
MYKHILISTDGSDLANAAVDHAVQLAKLMNAKLTAITVQPYLDNFVAEGVSITVSDEDRKAFAAATAHNLDQVQAKADQAGVEVQKLQIEGSEPWRTIVEAGKDKGCDLIVMASHGRRGLSAMLLGSETQKVLTHSEVPVLVVR